MVTETNSEQRESMESLDNAERIIVGYGLAIILRLKQTFNVHTSSDANDRRDYTLRIKKDLRTLNFIMMVYSVFNEIKKDTLLLHEFAHILKNKNNFDEIVFAITLLTKDEYKNQFADYINILYSDSLNNNFRQGKLTVAKIKEIKNFIFTIQEMFEKIWVMTVKVEKESLIDSFKKIKNTYKKEEQESTSIIGFFKTIIHFCKEQGSIMDLNEVCDFLDKKIKEFNQTTAKVEEKEKVYGSIGHVLAKVRKHNVLTKCQSTAVDQELAPILEQPVETLLPALA